MDKRVTGLLGAAAALTAVSGAHASAPTPGTELAPPARYQDLLQPVPDALAALKADDARRTDATTAGETRVAYHHHHHRWWRWRHRHHHHHHHW